MSATTRAVLIGAAVGLALAIALIPLLFMAMMMGMGGMMGMDGMIGQPGGMMGPGWFVAISGLLVIVGVVLLAAWGVRRLADGAAGARGEPPLVTLQRRYARGEIGAEEYERIRADLLRDGGN